MIFDVEIIAIEQQFRTSNRKLSMTNEILLVKWRKRQTSNAISARVRLILYVNIERHERFDERIDLKSIAKNVANCDINVDDEASKQLTVNFFQIWYVILNVKNRKFELFDVFD